jgi:lactoylglutathione lyase
MTRLHHANIRITDLDRSLTFYRALGLDVVGNLSLGPSYHLVFLGPDGPGSASLELVLNQTDDPAYDRSPGSGHIGLEVTDLGAFLEALARIGVEPEMAPFLPGGRGDLRPVTFVRDPDGVRVEPLQAPWSLPQDELPAWAHGSPAGTPKH